MQHRSARNPSDTRTSFSKAPDQAKDATDESRSDEAQSNILQETLTIGYYAMRNLLTVVERASEVFPPLKGAVGCVNALLEAKDAFASNHEEFNRLAARVGLLDEILRGNPHERLPQEIKDRRDGLMRSIEIMGNELKEKTGRGGLTRAAYSAQDHHEIIRIVREMTFAIELAMLDVSTHNETMIYEAIAGINWLKETTIGEVRKIATDISGISNGIGRLNKAELFKKLGDVKGFAFRRGGRRKGCIAGSRIALLSQLMAWAEDRESRHVFWLSGVAGSGKTAVAESFCLELSKRGMLGSSFFCLLSDQDLNNIYHIIPSLAKLLAKVQPRFGEALAAVLEELDGDMDPLEMNLQEQYNSLILNPAALAFSREDRPTILCVDAIDECRETRALKDFLEAIVTRKPTCPIKIFFTSRPEDAIRERMESPTHSPYRHSLRLQDIETDVVQRDIHLYLRRALENVSVIRKHYGDNWPPPELQRICERAGGLFIIASTLVRYIDNETGNRIERFLSCDHPDTPLHSGLQSLYVSIVEKAFANLSHQETEDIRSCLSLLVAAKRPLLVEEYSALLRRPTSAVQEAFRPLYSVVQVEEGEPVFTHHASFIDFLTRYRAVVTNTQPYETPVWAIDSRKAHSMATSLCLGLLDDPTTGVYFGVSGATTSYRSNIDQNLGLRSDLGYACAEWGQHALQAAPLDSDLESRLKTFLCTKVLYWIEALGVEKQLGTRSTRVLLELSKAVRTESLAMMLEELYIFAGRFAAPINHSAAHLYLSVLPFPGEKLGSSHWKLTHHPSLPKVHVVDSGASPGRFGHTLIPYVDLAGRGVALSPDGATIATGNTVGKVEIWDTMSGERRGTLEDPSAVESAAIRSLAFSRDGTLLASGSDDNTIRVWDVQIKELVANTLVGHAGTVLSVSFSPDGTRIVSGSEDMSVWVWDLHCGVPLLGPLAGHTAGVFCVAYSLDGSTLVSGSWDGTIRVWDAQSGEVIGRPFEGHTGGINSLAFSLDGAVLVSGSEDRTIRIWETQSGRSSMGPLVGHKDRVMSVGLSQDGSRIVSGSNDKEIRVWDAQTGQPIAVLSDTHSGAVSSLFFSPDATKIYSASYSDGAIRYWNAQAPCTKNSDVDLRGRADSINSVAYYPDGSRIVSGATGQSPIRPLQIWDARTGKPVGNPLKPRGGFALGLAISPDGSTIASGSYDDVIQTWDAMNGQHLKDFPEGREGEDGPDSTHVRSVAFSPDGSLLAFRSHPNTLSILDARSGKPAIDTIIVGSPPVPGQQNTFINLPLSFSPDGSTILAGSGDGTHVVFLDAKTGKFLSDPLEGHTQYITAVTCSRHGIVASASADRTVRIWDPVTATSILAHSPEGSASSEVPICLAFSPDGTKLVSGTVGNTVRVWDAASGRLILGPLRGHLDRVRSVSFSPDGSEFISGSWDGTIRVWDAIGAQTTSPPTFLHHYPQNSITMTEDGWICNTAGDLLLWVPPQFRPWIHMQPLKRIIAGPMIDIEIAHARYHGPNWLKCAKRQPDDASLEYGETWPVDPQ